MSDPRVHAGAEAADVEPDASVASVPGQATVHSFDGGTGDGSVITDDGAVIPFLADAWRPGPLLTLRVGQRLRVTVEESAGTPRVSSLTLVTFSG